MLHVFAIKDLRADCYLSPFFSTNVHQAIRTMVNTVGEPDSNLGKFSSDFALYQIGSLDQETGHITHTDPLINLGILDTFKTQKGPIQNGNK